MASTPLECDIYHAYNALQECHLVLDYSGVLCLPGSQKASTPPESLEDPDSYDSGVLFGVEDASTVSALCSQLLVRWPSLSGRLRLLPRSAVPAFQLAFPFLFSAPLPAASVPEGASAVPVFEGPFPSCIGPGVFLGSAWHASQPACLARCRFSALVNCMDNPGGCPLPVAAALSLTCHRYPWVDEPSFCLLQDLPRVVGAIEASRCAPGGVLLHCYMGASRSAAAAAAWLLWREGGEVEQVHARLQAARSIVGINEGFLQQLRQWKAAVAAAGGCGVPLGSIDAAALAATFSGQQ